ncbi:MAG: hypothetical protein OXP10_07270 [Chloroflexota bacterium]|nr:hypothetical protein [Chloroflexota bacterium]
MRIQEEYIVPGLGVVILLAALGSVASGASILYFLALGLLGLAAIGTYLLPHGAQVEVRVGIAVLGLLLLFIYFNHLAFWLALLSLGAMGALQFRHSDSLQIPPQHTVSWVKELLDQRAAAGAAGAQSDGAGQATGAAALQGLGALQGRLRVNVGGIGASVLGALALLCVLAIPWVYIFVAVEIGGETATDGLGGFTLLGASSELDDNVLRGLFVIQIAVTLVSIALVVLPKVAAIITSVAGMVMTTVSYVYTVPGLSDSIGEVNLTGAFGSPNIAILVVPSGAALAGVLFLAMLVLQLIPALNRTKTAAAPAETEE